MISISKYDITLRLVTINDAKFIVELRTGNRAKHLSSIDPDISKQVDWIKKYKERESEMTEFYFVITDSQGNAWGTIRIYNFKSDRFEVGSWVSLPNTPLGIAIKGDILAREFGFEELNYNICNFEVRKANDSVLKYHRAYKPKILSEDELNYFFEIDKETFYKHRDKLLKLI